MKIRSFVVSGLFMLSLGYIAPAMAENDASAQVSTSVTAEQAKDAATLDGIQTASAKQVVNPLDQINDATTSTDEGNSPDTATGDDDY